MDNCKYKIWYKELDENGNVIGEGVCDKEYVNYGNAVNKAHKLYGDETKFKYYICHRDPWVTYHEEFHCYVREQQFIALVTADGAPITNGMHLYERMPINVTPSGVGTFRSKGRTFRHICPDCFGQILNAIEYLKTRKRAAKFASNSCEAMYMED